MFKCFKTFNNFNASYNIKNVDDRTPLIKNGILALNHLQITISITEKNRQCLSKKVPRK